MHNALDFRHARVAAKAAMPSIAKRPSKSLSVTAYRPANPFSPRLAPRHHLRTVHIHLPADPRQGTPAAGRFRRRAPRRRQPAQQGVQFKMSDGVGCEACHGGAQRWLGDHVTGKTTHADLVRRQTDRKAAKKAAAGKVASDGEWSGDEFVKQSDALSRQ